MQSNRILDQAPDRKCCNSACRTLGSASLVEPPHIPPADNRAAPTATSDMGTHFYRLVGWRPCWRRITVGDNCSDRLWIIAAAACSLPLCRPYYCFARIKWRARMNPKARSLILTESQAACLVALRFRKESKTEIAIQAKLDLKKAATALETLKELGLARRGEI